MNLLVTGGAGFIGSHLCSYFIRQKHHITIIDHFDSYYSRERKKKQLEQVSRAGDFQFYNINLLHMEDCLEIFKARRHDHKPLAG